MPEPGGGARGATALNPIRTREGRLYPPLTTGTPKVFYLPASLKADLPFARVLDKGVHKHYGKVARLLLMMTTHSILQYHWEN